MKRVIYVFLFLAICFTIHSQDRFVGVNVGALTLGAFDGERYRDGYEIGMNYSKTISNNNEYNTYYSLGITFGNGNEASNETNNEYYKITSINPEFNGTAIIFSPVSKISLLTGIGAGALWSDREVLVNGIVLTLKNISLNFNCRAGLSFDFERFLVQTYYRISLTPAGGATENYAFPFGHSSINLGTMIKI